MSVPEVRAGDLFELQRRSVSVSAGQPYQEIGLRSFGKGVFHKEPVDGVELGSKRVFDIEPGDLLVSNVFAWEGAVAVASDGERGLIGSHRFMTWTRTTKEIDVRYVLHYLSSERGIRALGTASPGSAGRNRTLSVRNFEDLLIPVPHIDEQRAIATRLDAIVEGSIRVEATDSAIEPLLDRQEKLMIQNAMVENAAGLSTFAEINPSPIRIPGDELVHFVPMADVDHITGTVVGQQLITRSELGSGYKQFQSGDIIFARITPSMQNGKSAVFRGELAPFGYGSTEFHVLRPQEEHHTEALHTILRTKWFRNRAMKSFTGTAGQQRVSASHLSSSVIPDISKNSEALLVQKLREIDSARREAKRLFDHRAALAKALPQAARNAEFARLMN